jgi:formate hydrogenlyase transcriptional activator
MSLITIIWSMSASACLTLAGINILVWFRNRPAWANLFFSLLSIGTAGWTLSELWMMRAASVAEFAIVLKWAHVWVCLIIVSLVGFTQSYLKTGRPWLAWTVCISRTFLLFPNFLVGINLNYLEITSLGHMRVLGESVTIADGIPNPWIRLGELNLVLFIIFLADATITAWRRGDRHRALTTGAGIVLFAFVSCGQSLAVHWGLIRVPYMASVSFMGLIAVMGYELSSDMIRASQLNLRLQKSEAGLHEIEERMRLAVEGSDFGIWTRDLRGNEIWATDKCRAFFGFTENEPLQVDKVLERIHPEDRDAVGLAMRNATKSGTSHDTEFRVVSPTGETRWIASRSSVELDSNSRPIAVRGVMHDTTPQRSAFQEIADLKQRLEKENVYLREEVRLEHQHGEIIGGSDGIRRVLQKVEQVAPTDSTVLVLGETGTGKELIARTIHEHSRRRGHVMVKVNCAALPATLIESELFGREKGAFTGALSREMGRFELANGSTILLDEVGELPLELQAKLLRVLQEGEFERLGSSKTIKVDARVIAATSRNLQQAVREGKFREDLFYRLNVFPITVPPLRERKEDIPPLVWHFLSVLCQRMGRSIETVHSGTMNAFKNHYWPGNVRELRNVIERFLITSSGTMLKGELPSLELSEKDSRPQTFEEVERNYLLHVLEIVGWRVRGDGGAAEILGLKPTTLESRMQKLHIVRQK